MPTIHIIKDGAALMGTAPISFLREREGLCFISRFNGTDQMSPADDQSGYQRPPTEKRFPKIGQYYSEDNNSNLITPLILSLRLNDSYEINQFIEMFEAGDLKAIKDRFGDEFVSSIDGQHRLKGLEYASKKDPEFDPEVPFIMYTGLDFEQECLLFNAINSTQKNLPKALIEFTKATVTSRKDQNWEQQIRLIAKALALTPISEGSVWGPLPGDEPVEERMQVNLSGVRDPNRAVTYEGLRRSTQGMYPKTLFTRMQRLSPTLPLDMALKYWAAVADACDAAWNGEPAVTIVVDPDSGQTKEIPNHYRIRELVGVAALGKLGQDVISATLDGEDLETLTGRLACVDWTKSDSNPWMCSQAGFAGQRVLYEILYNVVFNGAEEPMTMDDLIQLQGAETTGSATH